MRLLGLVLIMVWSTATCAFADAGTDTLFRDFMKSREVVATLYFQPNSDGVPLHEKERLQEIVAELRKLQNNGRMIRVEGFSSPGGDQEKNFHLSFFRARAVAEIIEAKGLTSEIVLTGYGDLLAKSNDPEKERRVEIASYAKPVVEKKIDIAKYREQPVAPPVAPIQPMPELMPKEPEIDSYRIDQAIRDKIEDKKKGLADQRDEADPGFSRSKDSDPGLSQSEEEKKALEVERDYSQWRKSVDPEFSPRLSESENDQDATPNRGYSQWREKADPGASPGVGQTETIKPPVLNRGYSQWTEQPEPSNAPGVGQSDTIKPPVPNRGYSQWTEQIDPDKAPGVGQVAPATQPDIDAFMIEQAIREKVAAEKTQTGQPVTQVLNEE
jgi:flagellar motor protein MotB